MSKEEFEVIRIYDPAIRWLGEGATNLAKYAKSRDRADLALIPGKEPVIYHCRRLRRSRMILVDAAQSDAEVFDRAFAHGVLEIRAPGRKPVTPAGDHWTAEELEDLEWGDIKEVGSAVLTRSRTPFDCSPRYPVLRSSLDVWELAVSRFAAESQEGVSPRPSGPAAPSDSPPSKPGLADPGSVAHTAVPAPAAPSAMRKRTRR